MALLYCTFLLWQLNTFDIISRYVQLIGTAVITIVFIQCFYFTTPVFPPFYLFFTSFRFCCKCICKNCILCLSIIFLGYLKNNCKWQQFVYNLRFYHKTQDSYRSNSTELARAVIDCVDGFELNFCFLWPLTLLSFIYLIYEVFLFWDWGAARLVFLF